MSTTTSIQTGRPFDLSNSTVGLSRATGEASFVEQVAGPPHRIDGYTVGAPHLTGDPPHNGEMHPDADELLFLVSGRVLVRLELPDGEQTVEVRQGQALVVPRGVWHKIMLQEPGQLVHITPGPGGEHRPLTQ
jgi:mannose-6-phosphate isomerase-like protein (cupin superfamily)